MWVNMLFWAFLLTTVVYVMVGVACAVSMRLIKRGVSVGIPLFFLLYAAIRVICGDAIACKSTIPLFSIFAKEQTDLLGEIALLVLQT